MRLGFGAYNDIDGWDNVELTPNVVGPNENELINELPMPSTLRWDGWGMNEVGFSTLFDGISIGPGILGYPQERVRYRNPLKPMEPWTEWSAWLDPGPNYYWDATTNFPFIYDLKGNNLGHPNWGNIPLNSIFLMVEQQNRLRIKNCDDGWTDHEFGIHRFSFRKTSATQCSMEFTP